MGRGTRKVYPVSLTLFNLHDKAAIREVFDDVGERIIIGAKLIKDTYFVDKKDTCFVDNKDTCFVDNKDTCFVDKKDTCFVDKKDTCFVDNKDTCFVDNKEVLARMQG